MSKNERPTPASLPIPRLVQTGERPSAGQMNDVVRNIAMLRGPQNIGGARANTFDLYSMMPFSVTMADETHVNVAAGDVYVHAHPSSPFNFAGTGAAPLALGAFTGSEAEQWVVVNYEWAMSSSVVTVTFESVQPLSDSSLLKIPIVTVIGYSTAWRINRILNVGNIHVCGGQDAEGYHCFQNYYTY